MSGIEINLGKLRQLRGLSAIRLAELVDVSRQTIYAMEAGTYIPNTAVALRLARALETNVEDLFRLQEEAPAPELRAENAELLPGSPKLEAGQPVQLAQVGKRLLASAPSNVPWYFPAADAVVSGEKVSGASKTPVRVFQSDADFSNRILVAGCDPAISVLARHVQRAGVELVLANRNSTQSLELLREDCVHVAGTHLRDEASGESNLPEIARLFPKDAVAVVSFAVWEEGLLAARGNPKAIRGMEDLARPDVAIVNREPGAGSRALLDARLKALGILPESVRGYDRFAPGHLPAAWQVQTGGADACLATRAVARLFGLHFIPLLTERYDLVVRKKHLDLAGVQSLLDTLSKLSFRRELEGLGGYDARVAGNRML